MWLLHFCLILGSYFARDAKYSHNYTAHSSTRCMFVCRILVGDYTKGDSSYLRPPSKNGGDTVFFDSCVDDVYNPSIFVVFEKHQVYPEYLIQYREQFQTSASATQHYAQAPRPATRPAPAPIPAPTPRATSSYYVPQPTQSYSSNSSKSDDNRCIISWLD